MRDADSCNNPVDDHGKTRRKEKAEAARAGKKSE
jgi:hypothetical protein